MRLKSASAWGLLLALAACVAISPIAQTGSSASEDRNFDGQADVWQFYDDDGDLVRVLRDRNFDGYVDAREVIALNRIVSRVVDQNDVAPQPVLLPLAVYVGDQPLEDGAPVTPAQSSESRSATSPSGRAPPSAR